MARIITIANNKGGCGKTTTAANLAAALRRSGLDTLLIDVDGQANLTAYFGIKQPPTGQTTFAALKAPNAPFIEPLRVLNPVRLAPAINAGVLDIFPAVADLAAIEAGLVTEPDRFTRLRDFVDMYRPRYDAVIIDTPPAVGSLALAALFAADSVIITTQPQYLASIGLIALNDIVEHLNAGTAAILETRVLFTQYDNRKSLHRLTVEQVEAAGFEVFNTKIRDNVALGEAPAAGLDIFRYAPKSNGAKDYNALCAEYLKASPLKHTKHKYN